MNLFKVALIFYALMVIVTGWIYPLLITLIVQLTMPHQANGSLLIKNGQTRGSILIAQNFAEDRYFWPRPSAIDFDPIKPSGGSNLGPLSQKLKEAVTERQKKFGEKAPSELLYASGSGLDPHISLESAYYQIDRVAKASNIKDTELKNLIDSIAEGSQLGFISPRYVNVLLLNQALDDRRK